MRYYPVFLDLAGKPVIVIGGGHVAYQKMTNLVKAGAETTVVAPELNEDMTALKAESSFRHIEREYEAGDLDGYLLAFVATDDGAINSVVSAEARERGIWVNAVDDVPNCDFIMPGIATRGDITIAISTAGRSPALARKLRETVEEEFLTDEWLRMLDLCAEVRSDLRERGVILDADTWSAALDEPLRRMVAEDRMGQAKSRLLKNLGVGVRIQPEAPAKAKA
jgi:precorrin-2 dehydrogenase/sirohydrochlorin ferrochelatase